MDLEPDEQEIVDLLTKLKNTGGRYPRKLLASRRKDFLSQAASVGAGLGLGAGIDAAAKAGKGKGFFHLPAISAGQIVETVLVLAIVAQAGVVVYRYREKIVEFIRPSSAAPTALSLPVTGSPLPETSTLEFLSVTPTETGTPSPSPTTTITTTGTIPSTEVQVNDNLTVTPNPNGNNGNHYGQTPKPQRTKETKPTKDRKPIERKGPNG